jgi:hypothetical protein
MEVLTVNIQTPVSFTIIIQKNKISIYIKLPNVGFDKKFLTNILIPIVKKIRHETSLKNQETLAETLLRMGVQVYEMPEGENRDLATLYENNGFVGYEDLKEQVEHGVINAWQNKEKFEEIAKKRFKNIKDIIPNAVLFE